MWKLIMITAALCRTTIDSGNDQSLRDHLANLARIDRHRHRASRTDDNGRLKPRKQWLPRPRRIGPGELRFSNGAVCRLQFELQSTKAQERRATARAIAATNIIPFPSTISAA